jgi:hypothetical protein
MKSMPCQPVNNDRSVARKSLSAKLSIACGSKLGAIGLCLIGFVAFPIGSAIAEPSARPSTEQQHPVHQKSMGTWDLVIPAEASIDKSASGQMIFQSSTGTVLSHKVSDSSNISVLNETKNVAISESSPAPVPSAEQQAAIHRKLAGTWIRSPIKDEATKDEQERVVFRSEKEIESLKYRFGKLTSKYKITYQIVTIHRTSSSQFITIKFIDPSSPGTKDDANLVMLEFKNDRQLKIGLAKKNTTSPTFEADAILVDKISDSTDAPDRIPFKASLKSTENEALSNVSTVLRAQLAYRTEKGQYATSIDRLKLGSDQFDRSDRNQLYSYRTTKIGNDRATVMATPKNKKLRGYVALTYAYRDARVGMVYQNTICVSDRPGRTNLGNPIVVAKGTQRSIQCPRGSHKLN